MMNRSNKYWSNRANERMVDYLNKAEDISQTISRVYEQATVYITKEIEGIYKNFQGDLSLSQAKKVLKNAPDINKLRELKNQLKYIKDDKKIKEIEQQINAPAYKYRIERFERLLSNIKTTLEEVAKEEINLNTNLYNELSNEAYYHTIFDIQKGTGYAFSFATVPKNKVEMILKTNWSGKHYSQRIWGNTEQLAKVLKQELLTGFLTGRSERKTANKIAECMGVGSFEARRLVRTESNFISTQCELLALSEAGIKKYKFVATLDLVTSTMCRKLDGTIYLIIEALAGVNLPPLHPWCRSTIIGVLLDTVLKNLKRRARDPVTGKTYLVPADMTFEKWYAALQSN